MSTIFGDAGDAGTVRTAEDAEAGESAEDAGDAGAASRTSDSRETGQSRARQMSQTDARTCTWDLYFLGIRAIVRAR